uniref:Uncharacterized protein n=1 Tax=Eutreptiella gymnastica TaxID=73025 RepID=A0A7S1I7N9_9EUGL|mmetsp:Transcript_136564/g.237038  ORF Transcript_136564/g.237038 Transcript_136564/m.237038 type:complete len:964 (+) Transcript_136564:52-2943(+)
MYVQPVTPATASSFTPSERFLLDHVTTNPAGMDFKMSLSPEPNGPRSSANRKGSAQLRNPHPPRGTAAAGAAPRTKAVPNLPHITQTPPRKPYGSPEKSSPGSSPSHLPPVPPVKEQYHVSLTKQLGDFAGTSPWSKGPAPPPDLPVQPHVPRRTSPLPPESSPLFQRQQVERERREQDRLLREQRERVRERERQQRMQEKTLQKQMQGTTRDREREKQVALQALVLKQDLDAIWSPDRHAKERAKSERLLASIRDAFQQDVYFIECQEDEMRQRSDINLFQRQGFYQLQVKLRMLHLECAELRERHWQTYREAADRCPLEEQGMRGVWRAVESTLRQDLEHDRATFTEAIATRVEMQFLDNAAVPIQQEWRKFLARQESKERSKRQALGQFSHTLHQQLEETTVRADYEAEVPPPKPKPKRAGPPRQVPPELAPYTFNIELEERHGRLTLLDEEDCEVDVLFGRARKARQFLGKSLKEIMGQIEPVVVKTSRPSTPVEAYKAQVRQLAADGDDDDEEAEMAAWHQSQASRNTLGQSRSYKSALLKSTYSSQPPAWKPPAASALGSSQVGMNSTYRSIQPQHLASSYPAMSMSMTMSTAASGTWNPYFPRPKEDSRWRVKMMHKWQDLALKIKHGDEEVAGIPPKILKLQHWIRQLILRRKQARLRMVIEKERGQLLMALKQKERRAWRPFDVLLLEKAAQRIQEQWRKYWSVLGPMRAFEQAQREAEERRAREEAEAAAAERRRLEAIEEEERRKPPPDPFRDPTGAPTVLGLLGFAIAPAGSAFPLYGGTVQTEAPSKQPPQQVKTVGQRREKSKEIAKDSIQKMEARAHAAQTVTYADMLTTSGAATAEQMEELLEALSPKTSPVKAVSQEELVAETPPPEPAVPTFVEPVPRGQSQLRMHHVQPFLPKHPPLSPKRKSATKGAPSDPECTPADQEAAPAAAEPGEDSLAATGTVRFVEP